MSAIKKIRKLIAADASTSTAQTLIRLVQSLESGDRFMLADLYDLDYDTFGLAIDLLKDWRLQRYYTERGKLLDVAAKAGEIRH